MPRYLIDFVGRPVGRLSPLTEHVRRDVEAPTRIAAAMSAYDTHEHIVGGAEGVRVDRYREQDDARNI